MNISRIHLFAVILFGLVLLPACVTTTTNPAADRPGKDELRQFLARDGRKVLTFVGYSGAEYEDQAALHRTVEKILARHDPREVLVNVGVTPEGIGDAVYQPARERGFTTMGIVSSLAGDAPASRHVQHPFYITDHSWGGVDPETGKLSPTSRCIVEHSDLMIGIGGGTVARDELVAAKRRGMDVTYIPAEMNHRKAIEKARRKGLPDPTDFAGEASTAF